MSNAAEKLRFEAVPGGNEAAEERAGPAGCILLATVLAREGERFRVRAGGRERLAARDAAVDPALLDEAIATGARVVLEDGVATTIVGALATARSVLIDREGRVRVAVERFEVTAGEEVLLRTGAAFVRVKGDEVELFARRVLARARELARVLARAIQLN